MELPAIGGALSHHRIGADHDAHGNNVQAYASANTSRQRPPPSGNNQLQHTMSERKRREKINGSFVALQSRPYVLPPGSKLDKTSSILIRAREYVKFLESKLSELDEKNRELEARLASSPAVVAKNDEEEAAAPPEAGGEVKRERLFTTGL
uniref:BHLH domain-containing protein n=2 Tax=Oryza meridionalis TaxID=40149 RepID=A0A0E0BYK8_9ORYZ